MGDRGKLNRSLIQISIVSGKHSKYSQVQLRHLKLFKEEKNPTKKTQRTTQQHNSKKLPKEQIN